MDMTSAVDQYISTKNLLFGRWTWKNLPQQSITNSGFRLNQPVTAQILPPTTNNEYRQKLDYFRQLHHFSKLVNEFRFGLSRLNIDLLIPLSGRAGRHYLGLTGLDLWLMRARPVLSRVRFQRGTGSPTSGMTQSAPRIPG